VAKQSLTLSECSSSPSGAGARDSTTWDGVLSFKNFHRYDAYADKFKKEFHLEADVEVRYVPGNDDVG